MWQIDIGDINNFRAYLLRIGFSASTKSLGSIADIKDACSFIYCDKAVLYKRRHNAQLFAIGNCPAACANLITLIDALSNKVYGYFNSSPSTINTQPNFDRFHDDICFWFLNELNTNIRNPAGLPDAKYGNAQKMINIVFKYLSCYNDYSSVHYADLFSYCHLPIDNYILRELMNRGVPGITLEVCYTKKGKPFSEPHYRGKGWYDLDRADYLSLVTEYRKIIGSLKNPNLSYLAVEFGMWSRGATYTFPATGISLTPVLMFHF